MPGDIRHAMKPKKPAVAHAAVVEAVAVRGLEERGG